MFPASSLVHTFFLSDFVSQPHQPTQKPYVRTVLIVLRISSLVPACFIAQERIAALARAASGLVFPTGSTANGRFLPEANRAMCRMGIIFSIASSTVCMGMLARGFPSDQRRGFT